MPVSTACRLKLWLGRVRGTGYTVSGCTLRVCSDTAAAVRVVPWGAVRCCGGHTIMGGVVHPVLPPA